MPHSPTSRPSRGRPLDPQVPGAWWTGAWWSDGGPRRLIERVPVGVPLAALGGAVTLGAGAAAGVVPDAVAWGAGGVLFLAAEVYALYAWIAWHAARRARAADASGASGASGASTAAGPRRLLEEIDPPPLGPAGGRDTPRRLLTAELSGNGGQHET